MDPLGPFAPCKVCWFARRQGSSQGNQGARWRRVITLAILPNGRLNLADLSRSAMPGAVRHHFGFGSVYEDNSVAIQIVLLALFAAILIIFRKRVRYTVRK